MTDAQRLAITALGASDRALATEIATDAIARHALLATRLRRIAAVATPPIVSPTDEIAWHDDEIAWHDDEIARLREVLEVVAA